jgi:hypothetical protein
VHSVRCRQIFRYGRRDRCTDLRVLSCLLDVTEREFPGFCLHLHFGVLWSKRGSVFPGHDGRHHSDCNVCG